jgi:hypothetical protein
MTSQYASLLSGFILGSLLLTGCSALAPRSEAEPVLPPPAAPAQPPAAPEPYSMLALADTTCLAAEHEQSFRLAGDDAGIISVRAAGYGAPPKTYYPEPQRRLMAMRAARMDAYRALAETISGLRVWGNSTVSEMSVERDRYRTFIDAYVRGASVAGSSMDGDGVHEIILEAQIDTVALREAMLADCTESVQDARQLADAAIGPAGSFYFSAAEIVE